MIKYKITFILLLFYTAVISQTQLDALRYSENFYGSTAKSAAMGNSLSAVGADLSVLSTNPAGMAIFKKSQFTISPTFSMDNTTSSFASKLNEESRIGFGMTNVGFVGVSRKSKGDWRQFSFGMSYNKLNNYKQDIKTSKGENTSGSILDYYLYNANSPYNDGYGSRNSAFREDLAYNAYLIELDTVNHEYYSFVTDEGIYGETQQKIVQRGGTKSEFATSFSANYKDILMLGGTFGIESLSFTQKTTYIEDGYNEVIRDNKAVQPVNFKFKDELSTSGIGANFKFGFLLQPVKFIRFGAAIHSTSFYSLTDTYDASTDVEFPTPNANDSYTEYADSGDPTDFSYKLRTPFRANAGLAFILDQYKMGKFYTVPMIISLDYDFVDYSRTFLKATTLSDYDYSNTNNEIRSQYGQAHNLRAGLEVNFGTIQLRGGYGLYTNPSKSKANFMDGARSVYSGGLGFSWQGTYLDLAYVNSQSTETLYMYDATPTFPQNPMGAVAEPTANLSRSSHYVHVTLGFRW